LSLASHCENSQSDWQDSAAFGRRKVMNGAKSRFDVVRAWKDARYRAALSELERSILPPNPAGTVELSDNELTGINGGVTWTITTSSEPCGVVVFTAVTFTIEVLSNQSGGTMPVMLKSPGR
jgi:mersacidin/lichenicidin family type 2 lantibiotic